MTRHSEGLGPILAANQHPIFYAPPEKGWFRRKLWAWRTLLRIVWYKGAFRYGFWWGVSFGMALIMLEQWVVRKILFYLLG